MPTNYREWQSQRHDDEPRDQQRDLVGPFWASIGPDNQRGREEWSWTVMDFDRDNAEVASGFADTEIDAKLAVERWSLMHTEPPCEQCGGRGWFPSAHDGSRERAWIERCDTCQRYDGDLSAGKAALAAGLSVGLAAPGGSGYQQPYLIGVELDDSYAYLEGKGI